MVALTRDGILRTAVTLADREGFEAVTLRRIAAELGVHVTSLYNHVATREAVTDGIIELLLDEAKLPLVAVGWETWVRRFVAGMAELSATHPGAVTALQRRPVQGARAAATFEVALAAFRHAGFDPHDAYNAVKATALTALSTGLEQALSVTGQAPETSVDELPADQFPQVRLVSALADPESAWSFSLETLIFGLRTQLRRRRK
ncbi:TetR family transcriptional regulator [Jatrophihabitans lederbergiae]|uniref:TetR family transcriptional regulator n=1 Tax=Jatrophihabitans lederbergiae TaxID=3075547 RepID=A0ABU2J9P2_9ACTN|nr:TetR family transcriptional regulator [Jatrophihabitans sp. DSM 44399]MDT0261433.1 TetR family transcriptional regulator [Jatrophihabitans sp. DSM 44399]